LRQARRREGGYLLRSNIKSDDPGYLWRLYLQLRPTCKNAAVPEMVDKSAIQPFIRSMSSTAMEPRLR
jgi:hypothetical protein